MYTVFNLITIWALVLSVVQCLCNLLCKGGTKFTGFAFCCISFIIYVTFYSIQGTFEKHPDSIYIIDKRC